MIKKGYCLILKSLVSFKHIMSKAIHLESMGVLGRGDHRWVVVFSVIMRKMISLLALPMKWIGYFVDFILNLLYINGNFMGLISNFIRGKVLVPQRDSETFISSIGHLDGRIDLLKEDDVTSALLEHGSQALMDLCILASKLAYENARLVKDVVVNHWKMHFVDFYNCWNGERNLNLLVDTHHFQKRSSTQVFILCDKPKKANLILVSFRGTEPFDADDWSTDFDYSWYEIPHVGKVHMGFVEAMGLGNRASPSSFDHHLLVKLFTSHGLSRGTKDAALRMEKSGAYYMVRDKLKELLVEHNNAKVVVTGHSLGGALAILLPVVLLIQKEEAVMRRTLGVYTFGQPRIGDRVLGNFMEAYLNKPNCPSYVRVVYCNDVVPRIPCDDTAFLFKHFGKCLHYNSLYKQQEVNEEPDKSYFGCKHMIAAHMNAVWELMRAFLIGYAVGPEYKESWFSVWLRVVGLVFPGFSAHSPRDYVNAIRLGTPQSFQPCCSDF